MRCHGPFSLQRRRNLENCGGRLDIKPSVTESSDTAFRIAVQEGLVIIVGTIKHLFLALIRRKSTAGAPIDFLRGGIRLPDN